MTNKKRKGFSLLTSHPCMHTEQLPFFVGGGGGGLTGYKTVFLLSLHYIKQRIISLKSQNHLTFCLLKDKRTVRFLAWANIIEGEKKVFSEVWKLVRWWHQPFFGRQAGCSSVLTSTATKPHSQPVSARFQEVVHVQQRNSSVTCW